MGNEFELILYTLVLLVGAVLGYVTWYMNSNFNYWKKRGVHSLKVEPFFGNFRQAMLLRKSLAETMQDLYNRLEGHKYGGAFRLRYPMLIVRDPDMIKQVLVKDFQHFQGRGFRVDVENEPLSQHLLNLSGPVWRTLRTKMTPAFTSGKMKMMFHLMEECSMQLNNYLSKYAQEGATIEMKEVLAKYTTDIIGTCAFGLQFNSMTDENSEFREMGRKVLKIDALLMMKRIFTVLMPRLSSILKISLVPRDVSQFFFNVVKETIEYREKNNVKRNDFLQLLIQLKNQGRMDDDYLGKSKLQNADDESDAQDDKFEFTDSLLAAQAFVFFLGGFETSSTTMSFALYELAFNPHIQERLRHEVDAILEKTEGKITYEAIQSMKYMDQVIAETLRKYPPASNLSRECSIPYTLPDNSATIETGVVVVIPIFAIQRDPKYYPEPEKFDPERFTEENKATRHHFTYLPFGEGPRNCIGMRFGLLQSKVGIFTLLSNYEFSVCESTEIPLKLSPKTPVTSNSTGIVLSIKKRAFL